LTKKETSDRIRKFLKKQENKKNLDNKTVYSNPERF
jgi:hypothetical protein